MNGPTSVSFLGLKSYVGLAMGSLLMYSIENSEDSI